MHCLRCQKEGQEIAHLPLKGALGEEVKAKICSLCWGEWKIESVKIINDHRLNLSEPAARAFIATQMKIFLKLIPSPESSITITPAS